MPKVKEQENKVEKRLPYRALSIPERDMLFAFYEKWNGNMAEMVLDKDCLFKGYSQIRYYAKFYHFDEKLVEKKRIRAEKVLNSLQDGKVRAIENALRILEARNVFVYKMSGAQVFDAEGTPLIVEKLPYYKEIKAAWEIIKTELGEPTSVTNTQHSGLKGKPIELLEKNEIIFKDFNAPNSQS